MCYDAEVFLNPAQIHALQKQEQMELWDDDEWDNYLPHFQQHHVGIYRGELSHGPTLPVITNAKPKQLQFFLWGLVPVWSKSYDDSWRRKMANARAESLLKSKAYMRPTENHRALVVMTGYYEWRHEGSKTFPHYIRLKDQEYFTVAAVWEYNPHLQIRSFSMITTQANHFAGKIHNTKKRMPAIIEEENRELWLSDQLPTNELVSKLLEPIDSYKMEAHTIPRYISKKGVETNIPEIKIEQEYLELKIIDLQNDIV